MACLVTPVPISILEALQTCQTFCNRNNMIIVQNHSPLEKKRLTICLTVKDLSQCPSNNLIQVFVPANSLCSAFASDVRVPECSRRTQSFADCLTRAQNQNQDRCKIREHIH